MRPNLNAEKFLKWPKIDTIEFIQNFWGTLWPKWFMFDHELFSSTKRLQYSILNLSPTCNFSQCCKNAKFQIFCDTLQHTASNVVLGQRVHRILY